MDEVLTLETTLFAVFDYPPRTQNAPILLDDGYSRWKQNAWPATCKHVV